MKTYLFCFAIQFLILATAFTLFSFAQYKGEHSSKMPRLYGSTPTWTPTAQHRIQCNEQIDDIDKIRKDIQRLLSYWPQIKDEGEIPFDYHDVAGMASNASHIQMEEQDSIIDPYLRKAETDLWDVYGKLHYGYDNSDSIEDSRVLLLDADQCLLKARNEYQKALNKKNP